MALTRTYSYFDNDTLVGLLLNAVAQPTLIDDYLGKTDVLAELNLTTLVEFTRRAIPADRFVEVRVHPV